MVLEASSYHFQAPLRMSLQDRSPVHMPQGLITLTVKTCFAISHVPVGLCPNSVCRRGVCLHHKAEESSKVSPKPSLLKP